MSKKFPPDLGRVTAAGFHRVEINRTLFDRQREREKRLLAGGVSPAQVTAPIKST